MNAHDVHEQALLGFLGGTGPHGRGLATRLAAAGHRVLIGSRDRDRSAEVAGTVREAVPSAEVSAGDNDEVARRSAVVFVTVPYEAQEKLLPPLADALDGKVVVSCVNPLRFDEQGPVPLPVPDGSAAQECQRLLPNARVVSGFLNISSVKLAKVHDTLADHVLLCGDDTHAKTLVAELVESVAHLRAVDAGPLRLSGPVEDLTAVLLSVNRRYKVRAGLALTGLADQVPAR